MTSKRPIPDALAKPMPGSISDLGSLNIKYTSINPRDIHGYMQEPPLGHILMPGYFESIFVVFGIQSCRYTGSIRYAANVRSLSTLTLSDDLISCGFSLSMPLIQTFLESAIYSSFLIISTATAPNTSSSESK